VATEQVGPRSALIWVGGVKAPDAETAMNTAGAILSRHLYAVTDGETGEHDQWIGWQLGKLHEHRAHRRGRHEGDVSQGQPSGR
jgi:hypothetical protein